MPMTMLDRILSRAREQDGVTMIIAMGVMLVTSLFVTATFLAVREDDHLSHTDTVQKEAYYAALAGVQEYEYQMQINPDYWEKCEKPAGKLTQETGSSYKVKILVASTGEKEFTECSTSSPFKSVIQSSGAAANTFRIESVGSAGKNPEAHHTIIATFKVTGFLNYIYYTNHEDEDPSLYSASTECKNPNTYYPHTSGCALIQFATGDEIKGPMHTNDAACVGGSASFGRSGHTPPDIVEFVRGLNSNCTGTGKYNTATGKYVTGSELPPPKSDTSLKTYVTSENEFTGTTKLVLEGATNEIDVTNAKFNGGVAKKIAWPSNGLIFVKGSSSEEEESCGYTFSPHEADDAEEAQAESESICANVYVHGTYSKPLTVGSGNDVIINGSIYQTGNPSGEPTGTATVGLIANNFVRIYHPVGETYKLSGSSTTCNYNGYEKEISGKKVKYRDPHFNGEEKTCEYTNNETEGCDAPNLNETEDTTHGWGSLENPYIYAGILATTHSFVVDNYNCGKALGNLNIYGALAQDYRGIVGTSGGTGYLKDYKYDERLAVDEPPYFLNPLNAGWKVSRETAPASG